MKRISEQMKLRKKFEILEDMGQSEKLRSGSRSAI